MLTDHAELTMVLTQAEPLYLLISETFVLKGAFKWVRKQFVSFVQLACVRLYLTDGFPTFNICLHNQRVVGFLDKYSHAFCFCAACCHIACTSPANSLDRTVL
jgi:hypothetical protein